MCVELDNGTDFDLTKCIKRTIVIWERYHRRNLYITWPDGSAHTCTTLLWLNTLLTLLILKRVCPNSKFAYKKPTTTSKNRNKLKITNNDNTTVTNLTIWKYREKITFVYFYIISTVSKFTTSSRGPGKKIVSYRRYTDSTKINVWKFSDIYLHTFELLDRAVTALFNNWKVDIRVFLQWCALLSLWPYFTGLQCY